MGVDAFLDYALDLQHRFDHVEPFASMTGVTKRAIHSAVGTPWACEEETPTTETLATANSGSSASSASGNGSIASSGRGSVHANSGGGGGGDVPGVEGCSFNLDVVAAFSHVYCSRTDWRDPFAVLERAGQVSDHSCRITRQRAGISPSRLPTPPSPYPFSTHVDGLARGELPPGNQRYRVRTSTLVDLWRDAVGSRRVDVLKADMDLGWHRLGAQLAPLVSARAFSVLVLEVEIATG